MSFLHRTVRDFLETPFGNDFIEQHRDPFFDADEHICNSQLAMLKAIGGAFDEEGNSTNQQRLFTLLEHARIYEQKHDMPLYDLVEELDRSLTYGWRKRSQPSTEVISNLRHWSNQELLVPDDRSMSSTHNGLTFALAAGLNCYVKSKLEHSDSLPPHPYGRSLLDVALDPTDGESDRVDYGLFVGHPKIDVAIVELLLARGADPNEYQSHRDMTVWEYWLRFMVNESQWPEFHSESYEVRFRITYLFIKAGARADLNCILPSGGYGKTINILREMFDMQDFKTLENALPSPLTSRVRQRLTKLGASIFHRRL